MNEKKFFKAIIMANGIITAFIFIHALLTVKNLSPVQQVALALIASIGTWVFSIGYALDD